MSQDARPIKRPRVDARTDRFDFQPPYESSGPAESTTSEYTAGKRLYSKKQPLSCAECRRLKLKCKEQGLSIVASRVIDDFFLIAGDRTFPCSSCQKRGCAQICPHGALTSGKGSRFILANTEELHAKIAEMGERIRQLEEALTFLQSSLSAEVHPLLRSDLLRIKSSAELHRAQTGSKTASSFTTDEHQNETSTPLPSHYSTLEQPHDRVGSMRQDGVTSECDHGSEYTELPADIVVLSENFPVPWSIDAVLFQRIRDMLPPRSDAEYLCDRARRNAFWQYTLDPSETFIPNLVHHVYTSPLKDLSSRRLALIYMLMAIGLQVDVKQPIDSPRAEVYHNLARASTCETPPMEHPDLDLMHTLFYMMWYLIIWSDKDNAAIYAWSIMGLTAKLAQSLGLHRDGGGWKVIPEEVERRRFLFWELVSFDARLALSLGRPPSFNRNHIDTKRPTYDTQGLSYATNPLLYLRWKHDLYEQCLNPVLEATVSAKPLPYLHILVLDGRLRDFYVPPELDIFGPEGLSNKRPLLMQQAAVCTAIEIISLQLHRNYFTRALNGAESFTIKHQYAPSVIATYHSATRLITILEIIMKQEPRLCKRVFNFWFNMFSGAVAICLLVSRAPQAPVSPMAIGELQKVQKLFVQVAKENPRAARAHALLERLIGKAVRVMTQYLEARQDSLDDMDDFDSPRRAVRAQPVISDTRSQLGPEIQVDPFAHAHPVLLACVRHATEQIRRQDPFMFIPDSEVSLDEEDIRSGSFTTPTPSRMGNRSLNLDFGALTLGPDDRSLMTWF